MSLVAEAYGEVAVGVIMTGIGCDGAEGMRAIHEHGGLRSGEIKSGSSTIYGMPRVCAESGVLNPVVPFPN